jgi:hypothetical protein
LNIREGRNERQIDRPKEVLVSMRKDQTYRETKMLLLQKLTGIAWVKKAFETDDNSSDREWFRGQFRYESLEVIIERFNDGRPISCFQSKHSEKLFYVAFFAGNHAEMSYLTIESHTSEMYVQECGVQFCKFKIVQERSTDKIAVKTASKNEVMDMMDYYALMLPYNKKGITFQRQFTLIYSDWEVLLCNDAHTEKGFPRPDPGVFSEEYIDNLDLPP